MQRKRPRREQQMLIREAKVRVAKPILTLLTKFTDAMIESNVAPGLRRCSLPKVK